MWAERSDEGRSTIGCTAVWGWLTHCSRQQQQQQPQRQRQQAAAKRSHRSAQNRLELPSNIDTMSSLLSSCCCGRQQQRQHVGAQQQVVMVATHQTTTFSASRSKTAQFTAARAAHAGRTSEPAHQPAYRQHPLLLGPDAGAVGPGGGADAAVKQLLPVGGVKACQRLHIVLQGTTEGAATG